MKIATLKKLKKIAGKKILVRADFNVPLKQGKVKEAYKIEQSLPTIRQLICSKAKVVLISHLGRPKGIDKSFSLKPIVRILGKLLKIKVAFIPVNKKILLTESGRETIARKIDKAKNGSVFLLENIRFIKGEEENEPEVSKALAKLADYFVLDGFAVAHRDAASVSGVAKYLPSFAGKLMEKEVNGLGRVLTSPKKPFVLVLGGAKMETKVPLIKKLLPKADHVLIGGGIVNNCLWAKDYKIGCSIVDMEYKKEALSYWGNKKIIFPIDVVVGRPDGSGATQATLGPKFKIHDAKMGIYDIGPKTMKLFEKYLRKAKTIVWNGAMGMFETPGYGMGSYGVARHIARQSKNAFSVAGGGETVEILKKLKLEKRIGLVSTGGGAMLEFLSGKLLPGVKAIHIK